MKYTDITPAAFACQSCSQCPAVLETENTYVIIGKKLSAEALDAIKSRIADDEFAIEVDKAMIDGLKTGVKQAA